MEEERSYLGGEDEVLEAHAPGVDLLQLPHHVGLDLSVDSQSLVGCGGVHALETGRRDTMIQKAYVYLFYNIFFIFL